MGWEYRAAPEITLTVATPVTVLAAASRTRSHWFVPVGEPVFSVRVKTRVPKSETW